MTYWLMNASYFQFGAPQTPGRRRGPVSGCRSRSLSYMRSVIGPEIMKPRADPASCAVVDGRWRSTAQSPPSITSARYANRNAY